MIGLIGLWLFVFLTWLDQLTVQTKWATQKWSDHTESPQNWQQRFSVTVSPMSQQQQRKSNLRAGLNLRWALNILASRTNCPSAAPPWTLAPLHRTAPETLPGKLNVSLVSTCLIYAAPMFLPPSRAKNKRRIMWAAWNAAPRLRGWNIQWGERDCAERAPRC